MIAPSRTKNRRSIRLKGYDYTRAGAYFVTMVTWQRECLFGEVAHGEIDLSEAGKIVMEEWFKTGEIRPNVELNEDEFIIMPNHVHGIIWIVDKTDGVVGARGADDHVGVGAQRRCAPTKNTTNTINSKTEITRSVGPGSLGAIVRAFKSATTKRINELNGTPGAPVWQRNYYEHIIRNEDECEAICAYIQNNPIQWDEDDENPDFGSRLR